ncbi:hypothetical protein SNEBB_000181 [Seison nebaliae]|nr:hypothetical protein SNEBB_000181 [Seison nebaliae]
MPRQTQAKEGQVKEKTAVPEVEEESSTKKWGRYNPLPDDSPILIRIASKIKTQMLNPQYQPKDDQHSSRYSGGSLWRTSNKMREETRSIAQGGNIQSFLSGQRSSDFQMFCRLEAQKKRVKDHADSVAVDIPFGIMQELRKDTEDIIAIIAAEYIRQLGQKDQLTHEALQCYQEINALNQMTEFYL